MAAVKRKLARQPTANDEVIRAAAVAIGCTPLWADGMIGWAYHCSCPGIPHGVDQQCSVLAHPTACVNPEDTRALALLRPWIVEQSKAQGIAPTVWLRRLVEREQREASHQARAQNIVDVIDLLIHEHVQQGGAAPPDRGHDLRAEQKRRLSTLRGNLRAAILQAIWRR